MNHLKFGLILLILCFSNSVFAEETAKLKLTAPKDLAAKVCSKPLWDNPQVVWKGIIDKRSQKGVGQRTVRDENKVLIMAEPSLTETFEPELKTLLKICGLNLVAKGDYNTPTLQAQIDDFSAGVNKKWITGKATANSKISLIVSKGMQTSTVTVGSEIESKGIRKGNLKKIKKTLNNLLKDTLVNIFQSDAFITLLK